MMNHLYKIVRPRDFAGWADGAQQFHQDNQAVQNIKDIHGDTPRKAPQKQFAGFSAADLAKILKVKMPSPDPNTMDTQAVRNRSANRNHRTQGRASATAPKDVDQQRAEGRCFTCNKQGHISWNCPDKPADTKTNKPPFQKKKVKARQAAIEDEEISDDEDIDYRDPNINACVCKGQTLKTESKETIVRRAWEAETGMLVGPEADF